jgi:tetratricopeptide (TPR) repeat protein
MSADDDGRADERVAESRQVRHELFVLVVLCLAVGAGFIVTRAASRANDRLRLRDAAMWFERGSNDLGAGLPKDSIAALRRASALDPDNRRYRLALAQALVKNRDDAPARQVLVGLRALAPEEPEVNLQLARLEARQGNLSASVKYYSSALYGQWNDDRQGDRRKARTEFVRYLLGHGQPDRALSELLILDANASDELVPHLEAGELFMEAGEPRRALDHFRRALTFDSESIRALGGGGQAAFTLGDYELARRLLDRALDSPKGRSVWLQEMQQIASLVVERDPLRPRLSTSERRTRLVAALARAEARLDLCPRGPASSPSLEQLYTEVSAFQASRAHGARNSGIEDFEDGLSTIYRVELETAPCGPRSVLDRALLLIAERHDIDQP